MLVFNRTALSEQLPWDIARITCTQVNAQAVSHGCSLLSAVTSAPNALSHIALQQLTPPSLYPTPCCSDIRFRCLRSVSEHLSSSLLPPSNLVSLSLGKQHPGTASLWAMLVVFISFRILRETTLQACGRCWWCTMTRLERLQ
ncbi:hypothetical protein CY34DRAFT_533057 [Suillus luteus UH-Slu-Lm8-n1]|uniref:Uncharacterized protein n=1 Tax=Suillus luteus UH-Slu-Lm8-n1 TaxID=930992 RepID=A0A0C9ZFI8_9AGAM|nr:hypothetical protein CY34DRAFT_533057 [Suillus luteus UH-Slu-Lm8-n1]